MGCLSLRAYVVDELALTLPPKEGRGGKGKRLRRKGRWLRYIIIIIIYIKYIISIHGSPDKHVVWATYTGPADVVVFLTSFVFFLFVVFLLAFFVCFVFPFLFLPSYRKSMATMGNYKV